MSNRFVIIAVIALAAIAALPRFAQLGELGFYGDEEITAFAARALAEGDRPRMPSGMPYDRALAYSITAAASAALIGETDELSYRVPAAITGTLAAILVFVLARPLLGTPAALFAGLIFALSEWHVLVSREARMYSPFLLLFVCSALLALRAIRSGSRSELAGSIACGLVSATLHPLSAFTALPFALGVLVVRHAKLSRIAAFGAAGLLSVFGILYAQGIEIRAYGRWKEARDVSTSGPTSTDPWWRVSVFDPGPFGFFGLAIGAGLGIWLTLRLTRARSEGIDPLVRAAAIAMGAVAGALTVAAQLYGAALLWSMLFLLLQTSPLPAIRKGRLPLALLAIAACAAAGVQLFQTENLYTAVRGMLAVPFPYLWFFGQMFLGLLLLCVLVPFLPAAADEPAESNDSLRCIGLLALAPFVIVGLVSQWGGMRYLIVAYPFLVLLAAVSLHRVASLIVRKAAPQAPNAVALALGMAIIAAGVLGGHGVPQAVRAAALEYGDHTDPLTFGFSLYPDHRNTGHYVRKRLRPDDIVVAEDALQQRWYTGRVDYWLRNEEISAPFLYRNADGHLRDIYADSAALAPRELQRLAAEGERRIWVITSAEARENDALALTKAQLAWLQRIEAAHRPVFEGADGTSRVYCLNCPDATGEWDELHTGRDTPRLQ